MNANGPGIFWEAVLVGFGEPQTLVVGVGSALPQTQALKDLARL